MARARRRPARTGGTATGRDAGRDADRATGNLAFRVSGDVQLLVLFYGLSILAPSMGSRACG